MGIETRAWTLWGLRQGHVFCRHTFDLSIVLHCQIPARLGWVFKTSILCLAVGELATICRVTALNGATLAVAGGALWGGYERGGGMKGVKGGRSRGMKREEMEKEFMVMAHGRKREPEVVEKLYVCVFSTEK